MITALEFRERWEGVQGALGERSARLIVPRKEVLLALEIPDKQRAFLAEVGLPEDAAPFLSFRELDSDLPFIFDVWGCASDWTDDERRRLRPFRTIGSDGCGNPICLDLANGGKVVVLDHERSFEIDAFMNTGVIELAASLLAFREMIAEAIIINGADAYLDDRIPEESRTRAAASISQADPAALEPAGFWATNIGAA